MNNVDITALAYYLHLYFGGIHGQIAISQQVKAQVSDESKTYSQNEHNESSDESSHRTL